MKTTNKKQQLNEGLMEEFMTWFQTSWNDTSYYIDAYGQSDETKGEIFRQTLYIVVGNVGAIGAVWAGIKGKLRVPGFVKKIYQAGKAVLSSKSKDEATEKLGRMGIQLSAGSETSKQQTNEAKQIKKILTLLESQVDRDVKKKVLKKK